LAEWVTDAEHAEVLNSQTVRWLMTVLTSFGLSVKLWCLSRSMV